MTQSFQPLSVLERIQETSAAISLVLERPQGFTYKAGQHLPIRLFLDGQELRRTYTLSSSPLDPHLKLTIKRVKNGIVSNHLNDHVSVGDSIEAMPPIGHIYVDGKPNGYRTYYLFAAGSGITPMMSILRTVLQEETNSHVYLLYGNRDEDAIIFKEALDAVAQRYPKRFHMVHSLSQAKKDRWASLWSTNTLWDARSGIIDEEAVLWFIDKYRPVAQNVDYYICGPQDMNYKVSKTLKALQAPEEDIHVEYFQAAAQSAVDGSSFVGALADIQLQGQSFQIELPKNQSILKSLLSASHHPPYSCQSGICGSCRAKLTHGEVHMQSTAALEKKELSQGYILTCQAHCKTEAVALNFDT